MMSAPMSEISDIALHWPFSVSFHHGDQRCVYFIDAGGLRSIDQDVIHETPHGNFRFSGKSIADVEIAAASLGARLSPQRTLPEQSDG